MSDNFLQSTLFDAAHVHGENTAVTFAKQKMSYARLYDQALRFAGFLYDAGIGAGDRVAFLLPNCPQATIVTLGTLAAGAIIVPLDLRNTPQQLRQALTLTQPKCIVSLAEFRERNDALGEGIALLPHKAYFVITSITDYAGKLRRAFNTLLFWRKYRDYDCSWKSVMAFAPVQPSKVVDAQPAFLQCTDEGATMRAATHTFGTVGANVLQIHHVLDDHVNDTACILAALGFFHVYGFITCLIAPLVSRSHIVLVPNMDASTLLDVFKREQISVLLAVPKMFSLLLRSRKLTPDLFKHVSACISGQGMVFPNRKQQFERLSGLTILQGHGTAEGLILSLEPPQQPRVGSIGKLLPGIQWRQVGGELSVAGAQTMSTSLGYWNNVEATQRAFDQDGWLRTGSKICVNYDDYLFPVMKKKYDGTLEPEQLKTCVAHYTSR